MSKIEDHVVSLDLARKLKEMGYPQNSSFWWSKDNHDHVGWDVYYIYESLGSQEWFTLNKTQDIAAPLASELGEWLPKFIDPGNEPGRFNLYTTWVIHALGRPYQEVNWSIGYYNPSDKERDYPLTNSYEDSNEANLRAQMIIDLVENNYLTFERGDDE